MSGVPPLLPIGDLYLDVLLFSIQLMLTCAIPMTLITHRIIEGLHGSVWLSVVLLFVGTILGLVGFKDLGIHQNNTGTEYAGEVGPSICKICAHDTGPFFLVNCQIGRGLIAEIVACVLAAIGALFGHCVTPDDDK